MALLEVNDVHAYYGKIHALKGVSLVVEKGEIVSLIGGNGAGKTTTLRTISGLLKPQEGSIAFDGMDVASQPAHNLVSRGVAMVPVMLNSAMFAMIEVGRTSRPFKAREIARVEEVADAVAQRILDANWLN